jgi:hypothetical protein
MLTVKEAFSISVADPKTFGAFIEQNPLIRFKNVIKSAPILVSATQSK